VAVEPPKPKLKERVHPEAKAELAAAARRYSAQKKGLGSDLVRLARNVRKDLATSADMWAAVPDWEEPPLLQWRSVPRFPYKIIYYSDGTNLNVIAYTHERREPGYWHKRVGFWDSLDGAAISTK